MNLTIRTYSLRSISTGDMTMERDQNIPLTMSSIQWKRTLSITIPSITIFLKRPAQATQKRWPWSRYSLLKGTIGIIIPDSKQLQGIFPSNLSDKWFVVFALEQQNHISLLRFNSTPTHVRERIDLSTFLPTEGQHFYRYFGSLTTPGCNEVVEWTVIQDPIYVKPSLIRKFRQVRKSDQRRIGENHRPLQEIGERLVQYLTKK